jgi:3,4-dihydroxy 2-butanone 4-phosphate synthase/GTP cyclohydrolase II
LTAIAAEGCGAVVYLRGQQGRGIGLGHEIRAGAPQDRGLDTVEENPAQELPVDPRGSGIGAQILGDLGIRRIRMITDDPAAYGGLAGHGIELVGRVSLPTVPAPHDARYVRTARNRKSHALDPALLLTTPDGA